MADKGPGKSGGGGKGGGGGGKDGKGGESGAGAAASKDGGNTQKDDSPPSSGPLFESVIIHPLVLLSATDHHFRLEKDSVGKRVVGVLLGEVYKGRVDVTNSFAVPFDEDVRDATIFFLDHDYLERMFYMHKKISSKERIVGFYSTSPKLRPSDISIDAIVRASPVGCAHPVCVLIDVRPECEGLPVQAFYSQETVVPTRVRASVPPVVAAAAAAASAGGASAESAGSASAASADAPASASSAPAPAPAASAAGSSGGSEFARTFVHIPCGVEAHEAEEVGVEHLLRDVNDPTLSTLGGELRHKVSGLRGLSDALGDVSDYLQALLDGRLPIRNEILATVQSALTLLPNTHVDEVVTRSLAESSNDEHLALYAGALTRAVCAMHDLVSNKRVFKDAEDAMDATAAAAEGKAKEATAGGAKAETKADK